jgi:hypothetical protein
MTEEQAPCPFKIGDRVTFLPDERTYGWTWPLFEVMRLKPGDSGKVTRIAQDMYLYLDNERGGMHWECFKPIAKPLSE